MIRDTEVLSNYSQYVGNWKGPFNLEETLEIYAREISCVEMSSVDWGDKNLS